jgi:hypothetical protein
MIEARKTRPDLTKEELERLEKYGSLTFKSTRSPDRRVEQYPGCGPQGRAA